MSYYSERHGIRKPIALSYEIDPGKYKALLAICEKYYNNIAWKYPEQCRDGYGCCGLDRIRLAEEMQYEIPDLFLNDNGEIAAPSVSKNVFDPEQKTDDYNQCALLDFIEFMFENVRDVQTAGYHSHFNHHHLIIKDTVVVREQFRDEINTWFKKTGLLYSLSSSGEVERVLVNDIMSTEVVETVLSVQEAGIKELLQEAIDLHRSHSPNAARDATEKLWDAFERLKTYYQNLDKAKSSEKIISDMACGVEDYNNLFEEEFRKLTKIGNDFRIRHHETNKIEINDDRYYDYFFNRCLSLIALAVQYLK